MKQNIVILDPDAEYGQQLARALQRLLAAWHITAAVSVDLLPADWLEQTRLCLYHPVCLPEQITGQPLGSTQAMDSSHRAAICPAAGQDQQSAGGVQFLCLSEQAGQAEQVFRFMPLSQLLPVIRSHLPPEPVSDRSADCRTRNEIGLVLGLDHSSQPAWVQHKMMAWLREGRRVIYLALMPTYQMTLLTNPGQGPTLSALLLRLASQDPVLPAEMGIYLQPHPDGYLQFRPPERSDDLSRCDSRDLHQLVSLLREQIQSTAEPTVALVDCMAMPLHLATLLAVICDFCVIRLPEGSGFAAEAGRREVSLFLARLPPGCRIEEMGELTKVGR